MSNPNPHAVGAAADGSVMCDASTTQLGADIRDHCVYETARMDFVSQALAEACNDPNVMSGLIKQSDVPTNLGSNRRGNYLQPGPEREFLQALVDGIAQCPEQVETLELAAQQKLMRFQALLDEVRARTTRAKRDRTPTVRCEW